MQYNLAGIRQRVLVDALDDEEFDPGIVDRFINDTQRDIFNQYELTFQEEIFSGAIPAGSTMFRYPTDVAQIQLQVLSAPDGFQRNLDTSYIPFRDFFSRYPTPQGNTPSSVNAWTLFSNNMLTSAPTDQEYTMTIFYIKKPNTLSLNADVPTLPEEFGELLVLGALSRVQKRNEDMDLAAATNVEYQRILLQLVNRYGGRKADGPIIMGNRQIKSRRRI